MTSEIDDSSRVDHAVEKAVGRTRTLGEQTAFYGQALWNTPDAIRRYPTMVLRQIAGMGMGTGALAVIGGTVVIIGFLTLSTGALIAVQGYNTLSNVGIEALTGFLGAFLNVRFIAPATAGVALAATIGAGATAQIGAMRINEEIDALEVMGIRAITYLASTRIVAGVVAVIPIYTVAVLMSFLATRFGTTIIYGQSRGVYDHYFDDVPAADGSVVVLHRGVGDGRRRDGDPHLLRLHRDRRPGRRRRGGRPRGTHCRSPRASSSC